ncbi:MAG: hypothetical protein FWH14_06780 [Oscillospiraceae bacterium]|nr:hypothetical protein [Oscillospiraceae bacterium]
MINQKLILHRTIDDLAENELNFVYERILSFIEDYHDSHLTTDEYEAHIQAIEEDEWYD